MEVVNTLDIDGTQWNIRDSEARNDIVTIKENISNIQTLLSNTDSFKLNIRTRPITLDKNLYSQWSMGLETTPEGYDKIIMLPFIKCTAKSPAIAINAVNAGTFDNVYIYNPTKAGTNAEINLISIFKKQK